MKTKTIISIAVIAIISCLLVSFKSLQQSPKKFVMVRIIELPPANLYASKMVIVYEDGKTEEYVLDQFKSNTLAKNTKTINDMINDFIVKGYQLENANSNLTDGGLFSTYLFSK